MNDEIAKLDKQRGKLLARSGGWIIGDGVYSHGEKLTGDFFREKTYLHALVLNATGRMPDERFCNWVGACHLCLSWPDPRIWCNSVGSLAASARTSAMSATMAGLVASESTLYGTLTLVGGMEFLQRCLRATESGMSVADAVEKLAAKAGNKLQIPGYLRPIADGDVRVSLMQELADSLGYERGKHQLLALAIEEYVHQRYAQSLNFAGYVSAFLSDQGYTAEEACRLFPAVVSSGVTACYADDRAKPAGHFLPLRCNDVDYVGPPSRTLPASFTGKC